MMNSLLLIILAAFSSSTIFAGNYFSSPAQSDVDKQALLKKEAEEQRKQKEQQQIEQWTEKYGQELVELYLKQFDGREHTVVHELVLQKGIEQDDTLAEYSDDINRPDKNNMTPLALAAKEGNLDAVIALMKVDADPNGLVTISIEGMESLNKPSDMGMSLYLSPEVNLQKRREYWAPPLRFAAQKGFANILRELLKSENLTLDPSVSYNNSTTPLHVAKSGEIAHILLNAGANKNAKDKDGWAPLHRAVFDERFDVVQTLVEDYAADDWSVAITLNDEEKMMSALEMAEYFECPVVADIIRRSPTYESL